MGYTGINLENVKLSNRSAILKLLNDQGAMSRKDIAMTLGLTPATVTMICSELISADVLREMGELEEQKRAGRRKVLIGINYQYRYVLSISIEAAVTCIAISDLRGKCLGQRTISTDGTKEPEEFLKLVANEGKVLMWEQGVSRDMVLGVGVSVPGPVKRKTGVSQHAYRIWNDPVSVGDILKKYMEYPVIVENNVKAFAEAELIYGNGREQENMLFIKWGPGVGSAIIIHNRIYDSQNSKTAEIGHYIVEKNGKLCRCGRRGCLETKVATHPIAERIRESCSADSMPMLYEMVQGDVERIQARNMARWVTSEDPGMWKVLKEIIEEMAMIVVNTITLLAPDKVIIYGEMFELPHFQEIFLDECRTYDPFYREDYIVRSKLSDRIEYIGPLAVIVNEMFLLMGNVEE
ncbi:MAG: ROK family protein [Brotaphodocola sp.]